MGRRKKKRKKSIVNVIATPDKKDLDGEFRRLFGAFGVALFHPGSLPEVRASIRGMLAMAKATDLRKICPVERRYKKGLADAITDLATGIEVSGPRNDEYDDVAFPGRLQITESSKVDLFESVEDGIRQFWAKSYVAFGSVTVPKEMVMLVLSFLDTRYHLVIQTIGLVNKTMLAYTLHTVNNIYVGGDASERLVNPSAFRSACFDIAIANATSITIGFQCKHRLIARILKLTRKARKLAFSTYSQMDWNALMFNPEEVQLERLEHLVFPRNLARDHYIRQDMVDDRMIIYLMARPRIMVLENLAIEYAKFLDPGVVYKRIGINRPSKAKLVWNSDYQSFPRCEPLSVKFKCKTLQLGLARFQSILGFSEIGSVDGLIIEGFFFFSKWTLGENIRRSITHLEIVRGVDHGEALQFRSLFSNLKTYIIHDGPPFNVELIQKLYDVTKGLDYLKMVSYRRMDTGTCHVMVAWGRKPSGVVWCSTLWQGDCCSQRQRRFCEKSSNFVPDVTFVCRTYESGDAGYSTITAYKNGTAVKADGACLSFHRYCVLGGRYDMHYSFRGLFGEDFVPEPGHKLKCFQRF